MPRWYETLFTNFAKTYDQQCFTQKTDGEVDFFEREFGGDKSKRILDIGCGTGRHAIELTKRGYTVVGFDLSENQLARARDKASEAGVSIEFLQKDATAPHFQEEFDSAIMVCEGGFCLMETDEENFAILKNAAAAIRPGGRFIMTALNALFPLFNSVEEMLNDNQKGAVANATTFDWTTFRQQIDMTFVDDDGRSHTLKSNERFYTAPELRWLLQQVGFTTIDIFGCQFGEYTRRRPLTPDTMEMLVVADK